MLAIIGASSTSHLAAPDLSCALATDKLAHFLVFGLLATAVLRIPSCFKLGWRGALTAACIVSGCGILDEFRQAMTPGRVVEFNDWVADTLGALVAVCVYRAWPRYRKLLEWTPPIGKKPESTPGTGTDR